MRCSPSGVRTPTPSTSSAPSSDAVVVSLGEPAGDRVLVDQSVQADDRRPIARERVVRVPEERQRVMDRVECGRRLEDIAERYLTREQPWRLNDERQRVDRLAHGQVPAGEQHHPVRANCRSCP